MGMFVGLCLWDCVFAGVILRATIVGLYLQDMLLGLCLYVWCACMTVLVRICDCGYM